MKGVCDLQIVVGGFDFGFGSDTQCHAYGKGGESFRAFRRAGTREKGRGKKEEGRGKREKGRGKREEGRGKREMDQGNGSDFGLFGRNSSHMTVTWGHLRFTFRSLFGIRPAFWHTWITLGSLWAHFMVTLGVLWRHFRVTLCHFGDTSDE